MTTAHEIFIAQSYRDMAHVPRWVIARTHRRQSVAEHSYFVALYARQIAIEIGYDRLEDLLTYALWHDLSETVTGDIPGPVKRSGINAAVLSSAIEPVMEDKFGEGVVSQMRESNSSAIAKIVSVADTVEELCFLHEEQLMGNTWVTPIIREAVDRLYKRVFALPYGSEIKERLWRKLNDALSTQLDRPKLLEDQV